MHEHIFANAAHAEGAVVLKLSLRPFSIGHEILLWKSKNPLVTYNPGGFAELSKDVQRQKLFAACLICERSWAQNRRGFKWVRLAAYFRRHCKTDAEVAKFREYRAAGTMDFATTRMPRVGNAPFHYFGAPDEARLLMFVTRGGLYRDFGYESPFDFPIGLARQLYSAQAEAEGNLWIKNYQDIENEARSAAFEKENPGSTMAVGDEAVQKLAEEWNAKHPESPVPLMRKPEKKDA